MKTAVLLANVGTPDKPEVRAVRKYLTQFLNDRRVIDIPWLLQKILVNLIIVPFRAPKSTKLYKLLWSEKGSPLLHYSESFKGKLAKKLPQNYTVFNAMRYGNPSLKNALQQIKQGNYEKLIVLPLFPQYASSSTGTIKNLVMKELSSWNNIPETVFVGQFYRNEGYLNSFAQRAKEFKYTEYDHILFSYHGLPMRQIQKCHPSISCGSCNCEKVMPEYGKNCYKATCYETSRLLADKLKLNPEHYTVSFQSRLSKNWLEPFSDKVIEDLAKNGTKQLLVFAPAFIADCLETEVEIGIEYDDIFKDNGGDKLVMVSSLNDKDEWVEAVRGLVMNYGLWVMS